MALWANLHGGYIIGVVVVAIAAAAAHVSRHGERRRVLLVAIVAVALTGCTPTGFQTLIAYPTLRLSDSGAFLTGVLEEAPLFKYVRVTALPRAMPALAALFLLPLLTLWPRLRSLRAGRWDLLVVYLLTLGMGLKAQRYLVFMVPLACWTIALNVAAARELLAANRTWPPLPRVARAAAGVSMAAVLLLLTASYARVAANSSVFRPQAPFRHEAEGAADFLARGGVRGNVFNEYTLGGYLTWRLPSELKIFVYGRLVYPELLALYNDTMYLPSKTSALGPSGRPYFFYQGVLDRFAIDTVVIPAADSRSGDVVPLAVRLAQDDAWALVFARPETLVFLRKTPANARLAAGALPRSAAYDAMIAAAGGAARSSHGRSVPVWRRTVALATYLKGKPAEALRLFDDYLKLAPGDTQASQLRASIATELARLPQTGGSRP
jgi:hypothetical protein